MSYHFLLKIEKQKNTLSLLQDGTLRGMKEWEEGRDMGKRLFQGMAELLKENNLQARDIAQFEIDSDMKENYTSMRIAETVKRVYTFGVTFSRSREESQ